jgi:hypothetical protein
MELTFPDPPPKVVGFHAPPPEVKDLAEERAVTLGARSGGVDHVLAFVQAQGPFQGFGLGWGGGARLGFNFGEPWFGGDIDLVAAQSEARSELGSVRASTWSSGLRASFRLWLDPVWLEAGPGFRVGIARLAGTPADDTEVAGGTVAGVWAGPMGYAGLGLEFWHLAFTLGAEGGYALRGVSGRIADAEPVAIDGPWLAVSAGLGWGQ